MFEILGRAFDVAGVARRIRRGPWRAEVAERSMAPALLPGDWLLLDPTCQRWPRPGSIVVIREPRTGILAIKRVAARGPRTLVPDAAADAVLGPPPPVPDAASDAVLGPRQGWVLGDAAAGSIDSRTYGALDADAIVARAWFRYGPLRRIGLLR